MDELLAGVSREDLAQLYQENQDLAAQLEAELEEAQAIERQMCEVSSLVSVFSEKVRLPGFPSPAVH